MTTIFEDRLQTNESIPMMAGERHTPVAPYPEQYASLWTMKDGNQVIIRPIRPEDEHLMVKFHNTLSDRTVYMRYFCSLSLARRTDHERLAHICSCDYVSEMVLVAESKNSRTGEHSILAVGRLNNLKNSQAEAALLVADAYQRLGLGTELLRRLLDIARDEGIHRILAEMLRDNVAVQRVFKRCGFQLCSIDHDFKEVQAILNF